MELSLPRCLVWLVIWMAWLSFSEPLAGAETYFIDYSKNPDHAALAAHDACIVHPDATVDLEALHRSGRQVFAYLSVVEVARDATYLQAVQARSLKVAGTNEVWKSWLMDLSSPGWKEFVVGTLAVEILQRNFDGLFLDTADSVELLASLQPDKATAHREALIAIIHELRSRFPGKKLVMNRGLSIWENVRQDLHAILIESMRQTFDFKTGSYRAVEESGTRWLVDQANKIKQAGLKVWVTDYVDPRNESLAFETARRIEADGFVPLITTPELDGHALAPLRRVPRQIYVLFGNDSSDPENIIKWPVECNFSRGSQTVLEWLGYEVEYIHVASGSLPAKPPKGCAGIIMDRHVILPVGREAEVLDWMLGMKEGGAKLVFLGEIPFRHKNVRPRLLKALGIGGSDSTAEPPGTLKPVVMDPSMNFEKEVRVLPNRFQDLHAPAGSRHFLSIASESGGPARFDAVYTCSWGGIAFDPYIVFRRPDFMEQWLIDPFEFYRAAFQINPATPVVDTTTQDGVRLFFTHIDGDGLRHQSEVVPGKISGEIILERIIEKYPFPHSVSVIEAEVRGLIVDQKPGDSERLVELARRIFALPYVEAGSHAYSHPFYWIEGDMTADLYKEQALSLKPGYATKGVDIRREIEGSAKYIQDNLLPPGKKVEIFLWSGNCKPPGEAIRLASSLGMECMNGGSTTISRKYPSITCVGPRGVPMGDEFQVFAVNDNDNVYQQGNVVMRSAVGSFAGGFIHLVDAFERTESPRRLKPANIYYHFYSGDTRAALQALIRTFEWARTNELHATTAAGYSRLVRDARGTGTFKTAEGELRFANKGRLRTFRIDQKGVVPDLANGTGLTGYRAGTNCTYIHADGAGVVRFNQGKAADSRLFIRSSTAPMQFTTRTPGVLEFTVNDRRDVNLTLGGAGAGKKISVSINGEISSILSSTEGIVVLKLPPQARVKVESL